MSNALDSLKNQFQNMGLVVDSPILDGTIKRCGTTDKPKGKAGWYGGWIKLIDGKDIICCSIGDWTKGNDASHIYKSWQDDHQFSKADFAAIEKHQAELQEKLAADKTRKQKEAAKAAQQQWLTLSETGNSQYLKDKDVQAYGVRFGYDEKEGDYIAIPIRNHDGDIKGLQLIYDNPISYDPTRNKTFTSGMEKTGNFHLIGELSLIMPICFAEGYATGASIHQATGYPVVVCFDAGNIKPVVETWHAKYSSQNFIICADSDQWKDTNTGVDKATDTAKTYGCYLVIPDFTGFDTESKPTDFNDLHKLAGLEHLKTVITQDLITEHIKPAAQPTATIINDNKDPAEISGDYPTEAEMSCYRVYEDWIKVGDTNLKAGTYLHWIKETKDGQRFIVNSWICSPLYIEAITKDQHDNHYGRYLNFKTTRGGWRRWCMAMSMLKGSGEELRGELLNQGVTIGDNKALLPRYLNNYYPEDTLEISTQTGWHKEAYILPDRCIGSDKYFYQSENFHVDVP